MPKLIQQLKRKGQQYERQGTDTWLCWDRAGLSAVGLLLLWHFCAA